jgi:hypothetical protein
MIAIKLDEDIYTILYPYVVWSLFVIFSPMLLSLARPISIETSPKEPPRAEKVEENSIKKGQKKQG